MPQDGGMHARLLQPTRAARIAALSLLALSDTGCRSDRGAGASQASYPGAEMVDVARIEFDDGDTFLVDGQPVRFLGIDTPEVAEPDVGIFEDQPFGRAAAESVRVWVTGARRVELALDGRDRYHRRLAHVFVDGELVAERLLAAGLAYQNVSHFGDNGFPDLADRILRAAEEGPRPAFEEPYRWRKKHQRRDAARP